MSWWEVLDARGFSLVGALFPPGAFPAMALLTGLGSAAAVTAQVCLVIAWLAHRGWTRLAWGLGGAVGGGWLLELAIKAVVGRPRPDLPPLVPATGYSFPSGHSLVSFVLYGYLVLLVTRLGPRFGWVRVPLLALPMGIGISRVYLGVHYPTDVLAGWLFGALWLATWWRWLARRARLEMGRAARGPVTLGFGLLGVALAATLGVQGGTPLPARCQVVAAPGLAVPPDLVQTVRGLYEARARGLLRGNAAATAPFYDLKAEAGRWSRENDETRIAHLTAWAAARGVSMAGVDIYVRLALAEIGGDEAWLEMGVTERFAYRYAARPDLAGSFGVGAWHAMSLTRRDGRWLVVKDWFSDPLHEAPVVAQGGRTSPPGTGGPQAGSGKGDPQVAPPQSGSGPAPPQSGSGPAGQAGRAGSPASEPRAGARYRREAAVRYADQYCGPAAGPDSHYNRKYRDYSHLGGDCANFVSQILSDPEAGGLATDYAWRYAGGKGTRAWVRAADLVYYLLDSGRAVLAGRGRYPDVGIPPGGAAYRLEPGDVIGYEQGGEIRHVSLLVGHDPAGYPLVNSHTGDRYHVPWDLGWDARTVFWLLHIVE